jgi:two-component system OmpR family sensor kinase
MNTDSEPRAPAAPWRSARLQRLLPRSLAARLATGVVILVIAVVLAVSLGTYFALQSFLYSRLDQQVTAAADQNTGPIERCVEQAAVSFGYVQCGFSDGPPSTTHEWIAVLGRSGSVIGRVTGANISVLDLTPAERARFVSGDLTVRTLFQSGEQLRVTGRGTHSGVVVVTGRTTGEDARPLQHLVRLELIMGASAVIVALAASAWGVRFSLRRLRSVTDTAQDVAAELSPEGAGLDRRVPVEADGTEVGRLAQSMNTLLAAVETQFAARLENERRMRQFLADASHELRTPLTSIRGYAELARMQRALGEAPEGDDDNLRRIESEGTRMSRLVEDLLMLARGDQADSGSRPALVVLDVDELLEDVVTGSRAAFGSREIVVDGARGLQVIGDPDQLVRAIRNLVNNAAMHTNPDGAILLRAFGHGSGVAIQVADRGPGLPPEEAAHVFERFWRADRARSRARGGSGLGLAIVASIVSQHHGTVHFESSVERGSTVTIWLPTE